MKEMLYEAQEQAPSPEGEGNGELLTFDLTDSLHFSTVRSDIS